MMDKSIVDIQFFGGQTPVQCWGTVLGKHFYFRARWQYWWFEVGEEKYVPAVGDDDIKKLDFYIEEDYSPEPYAAGYMPESESRELITDSLCRYLEQRGIEDIPAIREGISAWFDQAIKENQEWERQDQERQRREAAEREAKLKNE